MGQEIKIILKSIFKGILEILYPNDYKCVICGKEAEGICYECINKITMCSENQNSVGFYKGVLKELILKFKYERNFNAGDILVMLLEKKLSLYDKDCYLTYIPSGKKAIKDRGFNQCEYLATEIGYRNNYKVMNTLKKVKETKIQKTLSRVERMKNLEGAFDVIDRESIRGKKFIIIDDVITTGATLKEAKDVLKKYGALQINTLTIAKTYI
ncbi:MAG: ComF family protein [Clostridium sp.]|nr:ComF family protein [Clostridium sp.]